VLAVRADGSDARREKRAADPCRAISVRKATPDRYPPAGQPGGHPRLWLHLGPNYLGEKFRLILTPGVFVYAGPGSSRSATSRLPDGPYREWLEEGHLYITAHTPR